ncbi:MAG: carboxylating nicotinate-nucleotide diphosphorylase [Treponema sp.]|nr:carboxylating nicotinate-nucleotide diphosphorylase [Treponema sp.]
MNEITLKMNADNLILQALREDISSEDVSTNAVMPEPKLGEVDLIVKQDGIIAGLEVFARVFELLDPNTKTEISVKDGDLVSKGQKIAVVRGDIRTLLSGERTALNYLQRMSGIATYTHQVASLLKGTKTKLLDTRKTTPNNRIFEKYAVKVGGGNNHRYNLSDGVLLKDNHIGAAGSVTNAVKMAKAYAPFVRKIEVEVETLAQVREAVEAGADIIMLDNMDHETMREAMNIIAKKAEVEVSGNVTKENIARLTDLGVDFISSGALTHSSPILDLSLKNLHPVEEAEEKEEKNADQSCEGKNTSAPSATEDFAEKAVHEKADSEASDSVSVTDAPEVSASQISESSDATPPLEEEGSPNSEESEDEDETTPENLFDAWGENNNTNK